MHQQIELVGAMRLRSTRTNRSASCRRKKPSRWKNINTHTHLSTMSRLGANGLAVAVDGKCVSLDLI